MGWFGRGRRHGTDAVRNRLDRQAVSVNRTAGHRVEASATGNPGSCDLREVVNALLYQNRTGCQWRLLPHDFPA
nr:transposase [Streptomyces sp. DASNCL29]